MPSGKEHEWDAGSLVIREPIWNGNNADLRNGDECTVSAPDIVATNREFATLILQAGDALPAMMTEVHRRNHHTLANRNVTHILAGLNYFPSDVAAENVRQLDAGKAFANPEIQMVHGTGANTNENLIFPQLRVGRVLVSKDLRIAEFVDANGFHRRQKRYIFGPPIRPRMG